MQDLVKIDTIQKREKLNEVFKRESGIENGLRDGQYFVMSAQNPQEMLLTVQFQKGGRTENGAVRGVLDCDLLEIARDRLRLFQSGCLACRENAVALTHVEEALMWLNRRVEDRIERKVLGTDQR